MRLRHIKGAEEFIEENELVVSHPEEMLGQWQSLFPDRKPLHIEVGMGKGRFIMDMAEAHPDINYIGIERYSSVLLRAVQKLEERQLPNVRFVLMDAAEITSSFAEDEVDQIYLNFSDPWPKDRHAKRRLPSRQFLDKFRQILVPEGHIEFKTDNRQLFDFAMEEIEPGGFELLQVTYDLHKDEAMMVGNIMTEYEEKFSSIGNPICKYIIKSTKK